MYTIFKFGGASIKDAEGIRNVIQIIENNRQLKPIVVISALGKVTNSMEQLCKAWFNQTDQVAYWLDQIHTTHEELLTDLFGVDTSGLAIYEELFRKFEHNLQAKPTSNYDFHYDQIVGWGELFSSAIVTRFAEKSGLKAKWLHAAEIIKTDDNYRDVNVDWDATATAVNKIIPSLLAHQEIIITQGFIGQSQTGFYTTLGREGSDYTASILSYCLNAEKMIIWKDVDGVMNADPKQFSDAVIIPKLSYREAIEMTYYGAKVIHPKTIKPLQNKKIALNVRSFIHPDHEGTWIVDYEQIIAYPPVKVWKQEQALISISDKSFAFIAEKQLTKIFNEFAFFRIRINMMQNSAISFSVVVDNNERVALLIKKLQENYQVVMNANVWLLTIRHYTENTIAALTEGKQILLEQKSRSTAQLVIAN